MTAVAPKVSLYHLDFPNMKHEENSIRGIRAAVLLRRKWIDFDNLIDADGVMWNTHWPLPMVRDQFIDPRGLMARNTRVADMTSAEVGRLRTRGRHPYVIGRSIPHTQKALGAGLGVEFETKSAHFTRGHFEALRTGASHPDRVVVKAAPQYAESLKHAHEAGFVTIVLSHVGPVARKWEPYLDYHRGPIRWV